MSVIEQKTRHRSARPVAARNAEWLAGEWDRIAPYRDELISSGRDLSYRHILLPTMAGLMDSGLIEGARVLDAGCGTGTFIAELAGAHPDMRFVGIDPSVTSIDIARRQRAQHSNCEFRAVSIEELAHEETTATGPGYDVVIANMLLQNVADLTAVLQACSTLLNPAGIFVFAISHPCFWPHYWGYAQESWFRYETEFWIEAPFRTSLGADSTLRTTHVHRPLHNYVNSLNSARLAIDQLTEPMPGEHLKDVYPTRWEFPRFLIGRARPHRVD